MRIGRQERHGRREEHGLQPGLEQDEEPETQEAPGEADEEPLAQHERDDRPPLEAQRAQHGQLRDALARRHRHRVGRDEHDRENEDRADRLR
jgi:hypothetical protein